MQLINPLVAQLFEFEKKRDYSIVGNLGGQKTPTYYKVSDGLMATHKDEFLPEPVITEVAGEPLQDGEGILSAAKSAFNAAKRVGSAVGSAVSGVAFGKPGTQLSNFLHEKFNTNPNWRPGYPGEKHALLETPFGLTRANWAGPGTNVGARLARGDRSVDGPRGIDAASKTHDLAYTSARTAKDVRTADNRFIRDVMSSTAGPKMRNFVAGLFHAKKFGEDVGLINPDLFTEGIRGKGFNPGGGRRVIPELPALPADALRRTIMRRYARQRGRGVFKKFAKWGWKTVKKGNKFLRKTKIISKVGSAIAPLIATKYPKAGKVIKSGVKYARAAGYGMPMKYGRPRQSMKYGRPMKYRKPMRRPMRRPMKYRKPMTRMKRGPMKRDSMEYDRYMRGRGFFKKFGKWIKRTAKKADKALRKTKIISRVGAIVGPLAALSNPAAGAVISAGAAFAGKHGYGIRIAKQHGFGHRKPMRRPMKYMKPMKRMRPMKQMSTMEYDRYMRGRGFFKKFGKWIKKTAKKADKALRKTKIISRVGAIVGPLAALSNPAAGAVISAGAAFAGKHGYGYHGGALNRGRAPGRRQ